MRLQVLGPIEARDDEGRLIDLGGRSQRRLLALLTMSSGQILSAERLAASLGVSPGGLRTAIGRLRCALGQAAVETAPPGYVLRAGGADLAEFRALVVRAKQAEPDEAVVSFDSALGLWRGQPLEEFDGEEWARAPAIYLAELRVAAEEDRAEAQLACGRCAEVAAEMSLVAQRHPFRDRPRGLLMRALADQGRQTEALRTYQEYRDWLAEETGVEPSASLRELERRLASGHVESASAPSGRTPPRPPEMGGGIAAARRPRCLPWDPSSFIGREQEMTDVGSLLTASSLVTIIGVGGMGKTRLAIEVGRAVAPNGGAWLAELGVLTSPEELDEAVASALGISSRAESSARASIVAFLGARDGLLILDNCEHLLEAAAALVDDITSSAPTVTVLATSREPLNARGERLFSLGALSLPGPGVEHPASVALFLDRAGLDPSATPARDIEAIEEICRRLDGIPLAIELAAARIRAMSARDIADHLHERFRFLTGGRRTAVARHQTLQAAIDWSYRLLTPGERRLFARLSVFTGPFTLADAIAVEGGVSDEVEVLNRLSCLVDQSLVIHTAAPVPYRLLETLRAYGAMRLDEEGASEDVRTLHARHFLDLVMSRWGAVWGEGAAATDPLIRTQGSDHLAATKWLYEIGDLEAVSRLLPALDELTNGCAVWAEPGALATQLLALCPDPPACWGPVLTTAATYWIFDVADAVRGGQIADEAIQLDPGSGYGYVVSSYSRIFQGDVEGALTAAEQEARRLTSPATIRRRSFALVACCWYLVALGRDEEAAEVADELLALGRSTGSLGALAWAYLAQARICCVRDRPAALDWYAQAEPLVEAFGDASLWQQLHRDRASFLLDEDPHAASRELVECLSTARLLGTSGQLIPPLGHAVDAIALLGETEAAALLSGSPFCRSAPAPFEVRRRAAVDEDLRERLGDRYDVQLARGRDLGLFEAADLALELLTAQCGPAEPLEGERRAASANVLG